MDLQLADLGTTFATGAYVVGAVEAMLLLFLGKNILQATNLADLMGGSSRVAVLLGILSFAVGMLAEDLSNKFADVDPSEPCDGFYKSLSTWECNPTDHLLDREKQLRRDALLKLDGSLNPLGKDLHNLGLFSAYAGTDGLELDASLASGTKIPDKERVSDAANKLYYIAKNSVYREDNYYDELKHIQIRIDFSRSVAIVSIALLPLAFALAIAGVATKKLGWTKPSLSMENENSRLEHAGWTVVTLLFLSLAYFAAQEAYAAEELEFNKRVFGYFVSLERSERSSPSSTASATPPAISGMLLLRPGVFLTIHDFKSNDSRSRFGKLYVTARGVVYEPVPVDWASTGEPSDLESICFDPKEPKRLLSAESGHYDRRFGRIFRLSLDDEKGDLSLKSLTAVALPNDTDNVEGMACTAHPDGSMLVILGERGGETRHGRLRWGKLMPGSEVLHVIGEMEVIPPDARWREPGAWHRDISDLYLDAEGSLWASAAIDPNTDLGPFQSAVYKAASVKAGTVEREPEQSVRHIEGLKVEALADDTVPGSTFSIGTDDEGLGAVWRPLF